MGRKRIYTDDQLLTIFKDEYDKDNGIKLEYFTKEHGLPSKKVYISRFGGIKNIKKILNIEIKSKRSYKPRATSTYKWEIEKILEGIEKLYNNINRKIKPKDIDDCEYLPSYKYMTREYGCIKYLCGMLNISFENKKKSKKSRIKKEKIKKETLKEDEEIYYLPENVIAPDIEEWIDLEIDYIKPYYKISNLGNVKNKNTNRILKPNINGGYKSVNLRTIDDKMKIILIHRLVAMCFMGFDIKRRDLVVHHINEDKYCNHINNLEICTYSKNTLYSKRINSKMKNTTPLEYDDEDEYFVGEIWMKHFNYLVSNFGRVKNETTNKILKQRYTDSGYKTVTLYENGQTKQYRVHRLVAELFIENKENKQIVNHIDGNKQNNCADNLEWCTQKENIQHAHNNELVNHKNYFNYEEIEDMFTEKYENNKTYVYIAKKYNTSEVNIRNIFINKINKYKIYVDEISIKYNINS